MERLVEDKLLKAEAAKRGISREELLALELKLDFCGAYERRNRCLLHIQ